MIEQIFGVRPDDAFRFTPAFTSAEQAVVVDTELPVAHGLSAIPTLVSVVLRCKTTEHGYAVGDEVDVATLDTSVLDRGVTISQNATNVVIMPASNIDLVSRTTANHVTITAANWRWVVRCWL